MASQINDGLDGRITVLRTSSVVLHDAAGAERLRLDFLRADAGSRIYAFYDGWSTGVCVNLVIRDLRDDAPFGPRLEFVIKPDEGIEDDAREVRRHLFKALQDLGLEMQVEMSDDSD